MFWIFSATLRGHCALAVNPTIFDASALPSFFYLLDDAQVGVFLNGKTHG
jgi:hypothetical protein